MEYIFVVVGLGSASVLPNFAQLCRNLHDVQFCSINARVRFAQFYSIENVDIGMDHVRIIVPKAVAARTGTAI